MDYCCYIDVRNDDDYHGDPPERVPCVGESQFRIITGSAPDDYTESCGKHLGEMIPDIGAYVSPIFTATGT